MNAWRHGTTDDVKRTSHPIDIRRAERWRLREPHCSMQHTVAVAYNGNGSGGCYCCTCSMQMDYRSRLAPVPSKPTPPLSTTRPAAVYPPWCLSCILFVPLILKISGPSSSLLFIVFTHPPYSSSLSVLLLPCSSSFLIFIILTIFLSPSSCSASYIIILFFILLDLHSPSSSSYLPCIPLSLPPHYYPSCKPLIISPSLSIHNTLTAHRSMWWNAKLLWNGKLSAPHTQSAHLHGTVWSSRKTRFKTRDVCVSRGWTCKAHDKRDYNLKWA